MQRAANVSAKAQVEDGMVAVGLKDTIRAGADMPKKADATLVLDETKDSAHNALKFSMHRAWNPMAMVNKRGAIVGAAAAAKNATNSRKASIHKASINMELSTDADQAQHRVMQ